MRDVDVEQSYPYRAPRVNRSSRPSLCTGGGSNSPTAEKRSFGESDANSSVTQLGSPTRISGPLGTARKQEDGADMI